MDQLSALFDRFPVRAGVFYTGALCGVYDFERDIKPGHFHLVRSGSAELHDESQGRVQITEPSVIFMPDAASHRLVAQPGVDVLCATVRFGLARANPIIAALPPLVVVQLSRLPTLALVCEGMFAEAQGAWPGRAAALNRLCEFSVVVVMRHCVENGLASGGMLAGLADERLHAVLAAMHRDTQRRWTLDELAALARMSRGRFAAHFREVVGSTPGEHLTICRVAEAQALLREGWRIKQVAQRVGFSSASALTRAFSRVVGTGPTRWRAATSHPHDTNRDVGAEA